MQTMLPKSYRTGERDVEQLCCSFCNQKINAYDAQTVLRTRGRHIFTYHPHCDRAWQETLAIAEMKTQSIQVLRHQRQQLEAIWNH